MEQDSRLKTIEHLEMTNLYYAILNRHTPEIERIFARYKSDTKQTKILKIYGRIVCQQNGIASLDQYFQ